MPTPDHPPFILTSRFEEALVYAAQLHKTQKRKGSGTPYISHLIAVTAIVLEHGGGEDEAIAALLHDAIEDQGGAATRKEIRRRFGDRVTEIVDGCTDAETIPKPPWRKRKEDYIAHLAEADASIRLVSAADKLHNSRSILADYRQIGDALWQRFTGRKDGTLWYYRSLLHAFKAHGDSPIIKELERAVTELDSQATAKDRLATSSAIE
jgi:(p)ppGpp synthase/HD superfamily hydrolase